MDYNGPANPPALEVTDIPEIPVPDSGIPEAEVVPIAPEILSALGEHSDDTPEFGENIHENLAQRWQPILKKGLPKEAKDKLLKEYLVPSNCVLLQAPKLNAEISAAITDMARNRDKKMEISQQLLGAGITAMNRAMTLLITGEEKIQAIKMLSDSCRILTHLHHTDTEARIKMVTPGLEKSFLNVIKDNERDSTLFGTKLSEKIKASKAIEKQGLQIKKTSVPVRPPQTVQSAVARPRYQENWPGPSRYLSNRGGRGGQRRQAPATRKAQTAAQPRYPNTNKTRAQPQQ